MAGNEKTSSAAALILPTSKASHVKLPVSRGSALSPSLSRGQLTFSTGPWSARCDQEGRLAACYYSPCGSSGLSVVLGTGPRHDHSSL